MDERPQPGQTRREGVEAHSIPLADGNLWGLALPSARLRPRVVQGVDPLGRPIETIEVVTEFGYPLEIRRLIDDLRVTCERGTAEQQHRAFFQLAASLVLRVHDVEIDEVAGLLELSFEDLPAFVESVLSVVTGEFSGDPDSSRKREADA